MTSSLYRKESLDTQTQRLYGDVLLIRPISFWVVTISVLIIVSIITVYLAYGKFARKESVIGFLVPNQGIVRVYAPFNGVIENNNVIDGQIVTAGDVLFKVSTEKNSLDHLSTNQQLIEELRKSQLQLKHRIKNEGAVFDSELIRLESTITSLRQELIQLDVQIKSQQKNVDLAKQQWQKYKDLKNRNLILEDELVAKEYNYLNLKGNLESTQRIKITKKNDLVNAEKSLEQHPLRRNNRLQELESNQTQLREKLIQLESNKAYTIKAPINGRVTSIQTNPGQTVSPSRSLLTIIPENTQLYAELFLPSRAIGFVNKNQQVLLRYDAFPYQRFGLYEGRISQVAQAVINPSEASIPLPSNEPVYRVKVALLDQAVNAHGKEMPLQAGMAVSADIILEERSLFEWLLAPIFSLRGKI